MPEAVFIIVAYFKVTVLMIEVSGRVFPDKAELAKSFATIEACSKRLPLARREFNANSIKPTKVECLKLEVVK